MTATMRWTDYRFTLPTKGSGQCTPKYAMKERRRLGCEPRTAPRPASGSTTNRRSRGTGRPVPRSLFRILPVGPVTIDRARCRRAHLARDRADSSRLQTDTVCRVRASPPPLALWVWRTTLPLGLVVDRQRQSRLALAFAKLRLGTRGCHRELFRGHLERRQRLPDHGQFRMQEGARRNRQRVAVFFVQARITHPAQQPVEWQLAALRFYRTRPRRLAAAASRTA